LAAIVSVLAARKKADEGKIYISIPWQNARGKGGAVTKDLGIKIQ